MGFTQHKNQHNLQRACLYVFSYGLQWKQNTCSQGLLQSVSSRQLFFFFFVCEILPNFNLKIFHGKNGPNSPDFEKKVPDRQIFMLTCRRQPRIQKDPTTSFFTFISRLQPNLAKSSYGWLPIEKKMKWFTKLGKKKKNYNILFNVYFALK